METLLDIQTITHHAGIVLTDGGWPGSLCSETLSLAIAGGGYREISYLCLDGVYYNAKGEVRSEILDGRYPMLKGATSKDGMGTLMGYNPNHLDQGLLQHIQQRLVSGVEGEALDTATPGISPGARGVRRV